MPAPSWCRLGGRSRTDGIKNPFSPVHMCADHQQMLPVVPHAPFALSLLLSSESARGCSAPLPSHDALLPRTHPITRLFCQDRSSHAPAHSDRSVGPARRRPGPGIETVTNQSIAHAPHAVRAHPPPPPLTRAVNRCLRRPCAGEALRPNTPGHRHRVWRLPRPGLYVPVCQSACLPSA